MLANKLTSEAFSTFLFLFSGKALISFVLLFGINSLFLKASARANLESRYKPSNFSKQRNLIPIVLVYCSLGFLSLVFTVSMLFLFPNLVAETYALTVALFFAANRVISFKFIGQGKLVEVASLNLIRTLDYVVPFLLVFFTKSQVVLFSGFVISEILCLLYVVLLQTNDLNLTNVLLPFRFKKIIREFSYSVRDAYPLSLGDTFAEFHLKLHIIILHF